MSDEKQNTKHQTLDEFDFLRIHQFFIPEFVRLRKIEQNVDIIPVVINMFRLPDLLTSEMFVKMKKNY